MVALFTVIVTILAFIGHLLNRNRNRKDKIKKSTKLISFFSQSQ